MRVLQALIAMVLSGIGVAVGYSLQIRNHGDGKSASAETLPVDVYPDSRNRYPLPKREDLDDTGKRQYDEAMSDSRSLVGLQGPAGIRLYSPRLAESTRPGLTYIQYETGLGGRISQLAILVTARELNQQFEWTAHEPEALKQGLEQQIIDVVKYRKPLTGVGEKEAVVIQLGREAFGKRKVSEATFAHAVKVFGKKYLVDLASLMGQYSSTAVLLTIFDQQLLSGQKPLLPLP